MKTISPLPRALFVNRHHHRERNSANSWWDSPIKTFSCDSAELQWRIETETGISTSGPCRAAPGTPTSLAIPPPIRLFFTR